MEEVIKLANKRNLSHTTRLASALLGLWVTLSIGPPVSLEAQVHPRPGVVGQREE